MNLIAWAGYTEDDWVKPFEQQTGRVQVRAHRLRQALGEAAQLTANLKKAVSADAFGIKNVSASFGRQIARSAVLAIIVSLLLIVGYISIRFQWQFAVPAIVALIHDVLITEIGRAHV